MRNACRVLVKMSEMKMLLGRPRQDWSIILKWILNRLKGMEWNHLAQDRDL
jgi:hypothetical protein